MLGEVQRCRRALSAAIRRALEERPTNQMPAQGGPSDQRERAVPTHNAPPPSGEDRWAELPADQIDVSQDLTEIINYTSSSLIQSLVQSVAWDIDGDIVGSGGFLGLLLDDEEPPIPELDNRTAPGSPEEEHDEPKKYFVL